MLLSFQLEMEGEYVEELQQENQEKINFLFDTLNKLVKHINN
tara:strand:+ start:293 stop:418 length:126 start_codon:yes stop_codon:yes gene_type:complete